MRLATRLRPTSIRRTRIRPARGFGGITPGSVTFPTAPLTLRVMIALGADLTASWLTWSWVDITAYVRYADGISTRTGRVDESSVVTPGRTTLTLDNRDGRFSRRNPTGPYYGLLSKNTPLWVQVDAGSGFKTRVQHFINEWPTRWDKSGNDSTVTITASGVLRRLTQGRVSKSPLTRASIATSAIAAWPMEDGTTATSFASVLPNAAALSMTGSPQPGTADSVAGSLPVATFDTSSSFAPTLLSGGVIGEVAISYVMHGTMASSPNPTIWVPWRVTFTGGTVSEIRAVAYAGYSGGAFTSTVGLDIQVDLVGVVTTFGSTGANLFDPANPPRYITLTATQNASAVDLALWVDGTLIDTGSAAAETLGTPSMLYGPIPAAGVLDALTVNNTGTSFDLGQVSIHNSDSVAADMAEAATGHVGEMAHERIERVCGEAGIAYASTGATASSQALGPQPIGTPLQVIRDAEATDLGVVFEAEYGLGYQGKRQRYNAPVLLPLDFDQGHIAEPPEPADDDQRTRNRFTVSRSDGSEATVEDTDSSAAEGLYDDSATVNTETDDQLANVAGWLVHEGTQDVDRWPAIAVNLTGKPTLVDTWTSLPYGARMTAVHPPAQVAPDIIDAFIEGHTEFFTPHVWRAAVNTTPATIYEVYQVSGDNNRGRVDSGTAVLAADATSGATSLSVASTGVLWVQGAVNFDIGVAGERMTVTNITGATSPQTFTVTRSVNGVVKAQTAIGADGSPTKVRLWRPGVTAL